MLYKFFHACYILRPSHPYCSNHANNIKSNHDTNYECPHSPITLFVISVLFLVLDPDVPPAPTLLSRQTSEPELSLHKPEQPAISVELNSATSACQYDLQFWITEAVRKPLHCHYAFILYRDTVRIIPVTVCYWLSSKGIKIAGILPCLTL
jgi:hypothetical protein